MYSITGITGNVGGAMANALLAAGLPVRAVLRDIGKGQTWRARGCDFAVADMADAAALARAFTGTTGVFILPPPEFDPEPGYAAALRIIEAVRSALEQARPRRVVCLSTIGADAQQDNLLAPRRFMEKALETLSIPVTFLRPGWFLDNAAWDLAAARDDGILRSFLAPPDKRFPMVAAEDVGRTAAALIREDWSGVRIVRLEGPQRVSPSDLAAAFTKALGRPVRVETVPRDQWERLFREHGMQNPSPRMRMLDGFNEGWIGFPDGDPDILKGKVHVDELIEELVRHATE